MLLLVGVGLIGLLLKAKDLPEGSRLAALLDDLVVLLRSLVSRQVINMGLSSVQVRLSVSRVKFASDPDVGRLLSLNDGDAARV